MEVPHVQVVKEKLGKDAVAALQSLYTEAQGQPPSVLAERFRADHHQWLDVLDDLQYRHSLIERTIDGTRYLVRNHALPLIDEAQPLLDRMQQLYNRLRELYPQHLSEKQDIATLTDGVEGNKEELLVALYYLAESHNVWSGKSIDYPYADESYLCISEGVLRQDSIAKILSQYYEWHYINPKIIASQPHAAYDVGELLNFFSQEDKRGFPEWYKELDDIKKALIQEVDVSLTNHLSALPTIGLRTLLDVVIVDKVGDAGTFKDKLQKFEQEGYITKKHSELIGHVLNAGHASAHRAYFPNKEDLKTCIDVVKNLMESIYILHPRIDKMNKNTPKRKG